MWAPQAQAGQSEGRKDNTGAIHRLEILLVSQILAVIDLCTTMSTDSSCRAAISFDPHTLHFIPMCNLRSPISA